MESTAAVQKWAGSSKLAQIEMNPNIGKNFFMDNINFETDAGSATKSIGKVQPVKLQGNKGPQPYLNLICLFGYTS